MEEEEEPKRLMLFGRDLASIPCFRSSFLYGISGGIICGLVGFMFTSKPRIASHTGIVATVAGTWGYWMVCRYKWSVQKYETDQLKKLMEQHTALEGTPYDRPENKPSLVDA